MQEQCPRVPKEQKPILCRTHPLSPPSVNFRNVGLFQLPLLVSHVTPPERIWFIIVGALLRIRSSQAHGMRFVTSSRIDRSAPIAVRMVVKLNCAIDSITIVVDRLVGFIAQYCAARLLRLDSGRCCGSGSVVLLDNFKLCQQTMWVTWYAVSLLPLRLFVASLPVPVSFFLATCAFASRRSPAIDGTLPICCVADPDRVMSSFTCFLNTPKSSKEPCLVLLCLVELIARLIMLSSGIFLLSSPGAKVAFPI